MHSNDQLLLSHTLTDFTFIRSFFGNNLDAVKEMVELFLVEAPHQMASLDEQISTQEWAKVAVTAHSLKTSMRYMGLQEGYETFYDIELCCKKTPDVQKLNKLLEEAMQVHAQVHAELKVIQLELAEYLAKG